MPLTIQQGKEREALVLTLIEAGYTQAMIADHVGVRPQTMQNYLRRRGWVTKPRKQPEVITMARKAIDLQKEHKEAERKAARKAIPTTPPKRD